MIRRIRLLLSLIAFLPTPTQPKLAPPHSIFKRDSSSGDESLRQELERRASGFPVERYDSDPIFIQKVDTVNEGSTYSDPQTETQYYSREHSDKGKLAVALSADEDTLLPHADKKRVYIVLRQSELDGKPKKYYPSIAYLVDVDPSTAPSDIIEGNGERYGVEWAVWNDGVLQGFKYSFQFAVCRYSVIVPCKTQKAAEADSGSASPKGKEEKDTRNQKVPFPPNEYMAFFNDLDNNKILGRFQIIGALFDGLNSVLDGVGTLWCGLSGAILGQCHQYDPTDGFSKSQIGAPVVRSDGKILAAGASEGFGADGILGTITNAVFSSNKEIPKSLMDSGVPQGFAASRPMSHTTEVVYLPGQVVNLPPGAAPPAQSQAAQYYGRKKREAKPVRMKGWRTQFSKTIYPNLLGERENGIFYGIGHCPRSPKIKPPKVLYEEASNDDQVINFYNVLLRNGCISRVTMVLPALKADNVLRIVGKHLEFVEGNKLTNETKLNWVEEQKLCSAMEFYAISQTYKEARENRTPNPKSPLGTAITNSAKFLENFSLNFISEAKSSSPKHFIRLLRHLVNILRAALERLGEDSSNLEECEGDCSKAKELVEADKITLMGIAKFIIHGLPPKGEIHSAWEQFMKNNHEAIEAAVKESKV